MANWNAIVFCQDALAAARGHDASPRVVSDGGVHSPLFAHDRAGDAAMQQDTEIFVHAFTDDEPVAHCGAVFLKRA